MATENTRTKTNDNADSKEESTMKTNIMISTASTTKLRPTNLAVENLLNKDVDIIGLADMADKLKIQLFKKNSDKYKNYSDFEKQNEGLDKEIIITVSNITTTLYDIMSQLRNGADNPLHCKIVANHYGSNVVNFETFKVKHYNDKAGFMCALSYISSTKIIGASGIYAEFNNGSNTKLYAGFDGTSSLARHSDIKKLIENSELNIRLSGRTYIPSNCAGLGLIIGNRTISPERMILGMYSVNKDTMLDSYDDYQANVMDCSANMNTAEKLGIRAYNFTPNNIEWCSKSDNTSHGKFMRYIYKKFGRVYAISALDPIIKMDKRWVTLEYLDRYYKRVK